MRRSEKTKHLLFQTFKHSYLSLRTTPSIQAPNKTTKEISDQEVKMKTLGQFTSTACDNINLLLFTHSWCINITSFRSSVNLGIINIFFPQFL